jgi:small neutral amino acid transporter SnatA (MarC family)
MGQRRSWSTGEESEPAMDFTVINTALVVKLLLLLLIGMGPKIALVPFLEKTKNFDALTQRAVGKQMVITAVVTALVLFVFGALLMRLLHITGGAVAVGGGIILAILAIDMVHGPGKKKPVDEIDVAEDPKKIAVYPLAVPYLLNPVGMTILIIASGEIVSVASVILVLALVLLVGAFDYLVFTNIDKFSKRLNPTSLIISEVVFGVLLTAVAVQLAVHGLATLGIIAATAGH